MARIIEPDDELRRPVASITPGFTANAVRAFAELRAGGPVQRIRLADGLEVWAVLSYEEARTALTHPALQKDITPSRPSLEAVEFTVPEMVDGVGGSLLWSDPPGHTRLRRLIEPVFSPRRLKVLAERLEQTTDELLDAMGSLTEADLVESFTDPLATTVVCEMLGVPRDERDDFRKWSRTMMGLRSEQQFAAGRHVRSYLGGLIARKYAAPADDLLSELIAEYNVEDGWLTREELLSTAILLVVAGLDTTMNLLGNALVALFRQPQQADLLRARPHLIVGAIEELLRFDSPAEQASLRFASSNLALAGVPIRRGDVVAVYLGPASRAAEQADGGDPELLDVTRAHARHIAFGHGVHHCLGAPLARVVASIALRGLLHRFPTLCPTIPVEDVAWIPVGATRGPGRLPVRLRPW